MTNDIELLGRVVASLRLPGFSAQLAAYLKQQLQFDHLLILGCRADKHPIYLYDSITTQRDFLFQRYLTGSYLDDPFYRAARQQTQAAVLRLQDVVSDVRERREYEHNFIRNTGLQDELCICSPLDKNRWLLLFLGYKDENPARYQAVYTELVRLLPLLHALLNQQWGAQSFAMSAGALNKTGLQQFLAAALSSFGAEVLSKREQEITLLLIQGFDSQEIAELSAISVGTVKNHRKKIYAKLHVASLSELFQLFLTHLLSS